MYEDGSRLTLCGLVKGSIHTIFKVTIQVKVGLSYPKLHRLPPPHWLRVCTIPHSTITLILTGRYVTLYRGVILAYKFTDE